MKTNIRLYLGFLLVLFFLSSCSISKMRYSSGWNIEWPDRSEQVQGPRPLSVSSQHHTQKNTSIPSSSESTVPAIPVVPVIQQVPEQQQVVPAPAIHNGKVMRPQPASHQPDATAYIPDSHTHDEEPTRPGGFGIAGFVLSFFSVYPPLGVLAIVFSAIGMGKGRKYRGLAIAGLIIGIIGLLIGIGIAAA